MPTLLFTVAPPGVAYFHDLLTCLAKFDEDVSLEATPQFVSLIKNPAIATSPPNESSSGYRA